MESNHAEERHNNSAGNCTGERLLLEKNAKSSTTSLLATILGNNPTNSSACDNAGESGKVPGYQSTNH
jgi:hypothetical protein